MAPRYWISIVIAIVAIAVPPPTAAQTPDSPDPAMQTYLGANGLLNRGLYELAAAEYRVFLDEHEDHEKVPVARYALGVCLYRTKQYEQAIEALDGLPRQGGFQFAAEAGTIAGQCHLALNQPKEAAPVLKHVVDRHRDHPLADDAAAALAEALYLSGEYHDAVRTCDDFTRHWDDSPLTDRVRFFHGMSLMSLKQHADAAEQFEAVLQRGDDGPFADQAALLLARCYHHENAAAKAIRQYQRVLDRAASRYVPEALLGLATLLQAQGDHAKAATFLDRLLDAHPDSTLRVEAQFHRARSRFEDGDYDSALSLFEAVAADGQYRPDETAYWIAKCHLRRGDSELAAKKLTKAIETYDDSTLSAEMQYDHGVALLRAEQHAQAVEVLDRFRTRFPQHPLAPQALHVIAATLHQQRDFDRSTAYTTTFLHEYPHHRLAASVAFLAAENHFLAERYDDAIDRYRRFLREYPDDTQTLQATYRLGMALYRTGRLDEALKALNKVADNARTEPMLSPALLALGDIHFQRSDWKQAEARLEEYLSAKGDHAAADDALLKLGLARQRQDRHEDAITTYDRLLERFEDSPHRLQAMFERGQALLALGRLDAAAESFERVLKAGVDTRFAPYALSHLATIATQRKEFDRAATLFEKAAKGQPDSKLGADALFQRAQTLLADQRFNDAERAFAEFVRAYPDDERTPVADARRAIAVARQDRYEDAAEALADVEKRWSDRLDPALRASVRYERAWSLRESGRGEEAARLYQTLADTSDTTQVTAHALLDLAGLEMQAGEHDSAARRLRTLRKLAADVPADLREHALYRLGLCTFELGRYDESSTLFTEFVDSYADSPLLASASFYAGESFQKLGRPDRAVVHFERILKRFEDDPVFEPALLRLGEALAGAQRWPKSEGAFSDFLARFPDSPHWFQARFGIGWAREHQKQFDAAIEAYREVTSRHAGPTAARAQFQIGECLFARGKYDQAARELLKVDILYAYPEWSAAALYEAGRCFEKLGKPVEARRQFKQVADQYGKTHWAQLSEERLSELSSAGLPGH